MKVSFFGIGQHIASTRLRAMIPADECSKLGINVVTDGADIGVFGKHGWDASFMNAFRYTVFDICDDHFAKEKHGAHYRFCADRATVVTCNSEVMRFRIWQETGRVAVVIPDPYEGEMSYPAMPAQGRKLLWFGNRGNLRDIERLKPALTDLTIISDVPEYVQWSPEAMLEHLTDTAIVVIPTGRSAAKSANRAIQSIAWGKFVAAEPLPTHEEFAQFGMIGTIPEIVEWALSNREAAVNQVAKAQMYVAERYSPHAIGLRWARLIRGIIDGAH
jgi:hypothetical protein